MPDPTGQTLVDLLKAADYTFPDRPLVDPTARAFCRLNCMRCEHIPCTCKSDPSRYKFREKLRFG